jgi:hypothetical protein
VFHTLALSLGQDITGKAWRLRCRFKNTSHCARCRWRHFGNWCQRPANHTTKNCTLRALLKAFGSERVSLGHPEAANTTHPSANRNTLTEPSG